MDYQYKNGVFIYYLPKELDHYYADKLKRKSQSVFEDESINYLIFDFSNTVFMDSSGIGLITGRFRKIFDKGGKVYVVNVNPAIDKLLLLSGIYSIVKKKDTKEDIIKEMIKGGYYE